MSLRWACGFLAAGVVLALYWPGLQGGFLFDDYPNVVNNQFIHLQHISLDSLRNAISGPSAGPLRRPVSVLSFAISYFWSGLDPFAFKFTNLLIHLVCAVCAFSLFKCILGEVDSRSKHVERLAFGLACFWLLHPVNLTPVLLVVQRMTLLATLFSLMTLLANWHGLSLSGRKRWLYLGGAWWVLWPLAFFSKESALVVPLLALVLSAFQLRDCSRAISLFRWAGVLVGTGVVLLLAWKWTWLQGLYSARTFTLGERLLTEGRVLWQYLDLILLPRFESFAFYWDNVPVSKTLLSPWTTSLALTAWAATLWIVIRLRKQLPLLTLGVGWFLLAQSLESSFIPLEIAFEHRNHLPSLGLLLAGVTVLEYVLKRSGTVYPEKCVYAFLAIVCVYSGALTWIRAAHFREPLRFAVLEAEARPDSARANLAAAVALMDAGYGAQEDYSAQAIRIHLQRAVDLNPNDKFAYVYFMVWACGSERSVDPGWVRGLSERLRKSVYSPADIELPARLGRLILSQNSCLTSLQVRQVFSAAVDNMNAPALVRARFYEFWSDYELLKQGDLKEATALLKKGFALDSSSPQLEKKLASYVNTGSRPN